MNYTIASYETVIQQSTFKISNKEINSYKI